MASSARIWRTLPAWLLPIALLAYGASGVFSIESDESGVAFLFGRAHGRNLLPGIHWNAPPPFGSVVVEQTATNFVMPIGYRYLPRQGERPGEDLWLTGDTNIVSARLDVRYSIDELDAFLLSYERPRELIRQAGERAVARFLVGTTVDEAMTSRRQELTEAVQRDTQTVLDEHGVGIAIQSVTIEELSPPENGGVLAAFQAVQNSRADRERRLHDASAYRARTVSEAQGEAEGLRNQALADRHRRITLASGEADRFVRLAHEHRRAPGVTETRLYLESLERLIPVFETYIVEPADDGRVHLRITQ